MKKAFFINGGAGRVLCALPALEYYAKNTDESVIIIAEGWMELFSISPVLRNNVYPSNHKDIYKLLQDRELITPEPYRLNAYFNQQVNLMQAFDILINNTEYSVDVPIVNKDFQLDISKSDQIFGFNFIQQVKNTFKKDKVIIFQPFGSTAKQDGTFVFDESGRSFELKDTINIIEELSKDYAIVVMSSFIPKIATQVAAIIPENLNLLQWLGIIYAADYFIGCDSVGQHMANMLEKPTTVVIGSTFPENISYPNNKNFTIIDNGKGTRKYSPIRITVDLMIERNNEHLMILNSNCINSIISKIRTILGVNVNKSHSCSIDHTCSCASSTDSTSTPTAVKKNTDSKQIPVANTSINTKGK